MRSNEDGRVEAGAGKDGGAMVDNNNARAAAEEGDGEKGGATRLSLRTTGLRLGMPCPKNVTTNLCPKNVTSNLQRRQCMTSKSAYVKTC